ncbi:MAG: hypothetical protein HQK77_22475, partial [Desulfobacterales bacterium]|nr:hypothetical protein [Desulfobacterales bacterium]
MKETYFLTEEDNLILDGTPIKEIILRSHEQNDELRKFARFMVNDADRYGSIDKFAPNSPLELLNQGKIESIMYKGNHIILPDINSLKKEAYIVYDDDLMTDDQVKDFLNVKAGLSNSFLNFQDRFNLITMMLPSYLYLSCRDNTTSVVMTKIKV